MADLPENLRAEIEQLCAAGDQHAEGERYADALSSYWAAWELLPDPKVDWKAATWILAAVGDANFQSGDYAAGRDNLSNAMRCPDAIGNAFLHLRLGQCQFELGNLEPAADELMRAYMGAGGEIFEDEDAKYLAFLQTRARDVMPPGKSRKF